MPLPVKHDAITLNLTTVHCHDSIQTTDYLKIGTPMQVVLTVISTWALAEKKWWLVWLVSSSTLAAVRIFRIVRDRKGSKGKHA